MLKRLGRFFWDNLIAGVLVILPLIVTVYIIKFLIVKLNNLMLNPLLIFLKAYFLEETQRIILAKFIIFAAVILFVVFVGVMTRVIIVRRVFRVLERFLFKLPMVSKIYGAIKELSQVFLGQKQGAFHKVVLAEYPRKGVYSFGFITSEGTDRIHDAISNDDLVNVYIPTTPNPATGMFVILKKEDIVPVDISVEDALKVVISGGAIIPPQQKTDKI